MRKKIIVICLFFAFCFLLSIANYFMQPTQPMSNIGLISNLNTQQIQTANSPIPYEPSDALINVKVERSISVSQGVTYVNDFFAVKNNKSNSKDFIQVGLMYGLRPQLYYISAVGQHNEKIRVQEIAYDGSGFSKWNLYLDDPILPNEMFNFTITMIFGDIVNFNIFMGYGTNNKPKYGFNFYRYPSSPYYSQSVIGVVSDADENTPYSTSNLPPWSFQAFSGTVTISSAIIECSVFQREIEIDRWGYLYYREFYQIKNLVDINKVTSFTIPVPADALDIVVYDYLSQLVITKIPDPFHLAFNITINWDYMRYPLGKGESAFFYVNYRRPIELHTFESGSIGQFIYQFDYLTTPWKASQFLTTFKLPAGCSILSVSPGPTSVFTMDGQIYINYQYQNMTAMDYPVFLFNYSILDSLPFDFLRPLLIAGLISIPLLSYIILKRELPRKKELRLRPTEVPPQILREFITLYSEKSAIFIELEKLEENLVRRKIKKREYRNQLKTIEKKVSDLNKELKTFQAQIKEAGGRYAKIIEELELREADRDMAREALEAIERRYRIGGRISAPTYRKLKKEEEKTLAKVKNDIEKLIQELRELMG